MIMPLLQEQKELFMVWFEEKTAPPIKKVSVMKVWKLSVNVFARQHPIPLDAKRHQGLAKDQHFIIT